MASRMANTAAPGRAPFRRPALAWVAATFVLIALGAPFLFARLSEGLIIADTTNRVPWGLWVVAYTWFSGLAGGLFLISSLWYLFRIRRFASVARLSLVGSLVFLAVSMVLIGLDLGALGNAAGAILHFRWSSALSWEIKLYLAFLIIVGIQLLLVLKGDPSCETRRANRNFAIRVLAGLGVALSFVGPPSGTGMLFAAVKARDFWSDGATVVLFYAAAVVTAASFLLVASVVLARIRREAPDSETTKGLACVLLSSMAVSAFATYFQLTPSLLPAESSSGQAAQIILTGSFAPLFWIGAVGIGCVFSAALAVAALRSGSGVCAAAAGACALIGVFALRYAFVTVGFLVPLLPGLPAASYAPNIAEIGVVAFASGLALGLFGLSLRLLDPDSVRVRRSEAAATVSEMRRDAGEGALK